MKPSSYVIALTTAICALIVTIHYQPDDSDYRATYVLKQEGEKITSVVR